MCTNSAPITTLLLAALPPAKPTYLEGYDRCFLINGVTTAINRFTIMMELDRKFNSTKTVIKSILT